MNTAAKNLALGNYEVFEEFTAYDDSDYDSSDCEEEPPIAPSDAPQVAPSPPSKSPPKSDKNHEVKPKEIFFKYFGRLVLNPQTKENRLTMFQENF